MITIAFMDKIICSDNNALALTINNIENNFMYFCFVYYLKMIYYYHSNIVPEMYLFNMI